MSAVTRRRSARSRGGSSGSGEREGDGAGMGRDVSFDDEEPEVAPAGETLRLVPGPEVAGLRLDRALADLAPAGLSRSRIGQLIRAGALRAGGETVSDPAGRVKPGTEYALALPPPEPALPEPEPIPLVIPFEDDHLVVVEKPAGMVVHPAPGAPRGTLVNALLAHCGPSLAGVGGVARPGIVHRIDKDTSGLLVVAKTDAAHHGLATLFAAHDIDREYLALCRGVPDRASARLMGTPGLSAEPGWFRFESLIDRSRADRTKMAVSRASGRRAVTRFRVERAMKGAALLRCRLETGRTHQIRVHLAHLGHPLLGDPVYGKPGGPAPGFPRQALHAARLGFRHPITGDLMEFSSEPPPDFRNLAVKLGEVVNEI
mgnify:CR=1 FL=1